MTAEKKLTQQRLSLLELPGPAEAIRGLAKAANPTLCWVCR
jgi:hypothetical protein